MLISRRDCSIRTTSRDHFGVRATGCIILYQAPRQFHVMNVGRKPFYSADDQKSFMTEEKRQR